MSTSDVMLAVSLWCKDLSEGSLNSLRDRGVPPPALEFDPVAKHFKIMMASVVWAGTRFDIDILGDAEKAIIIACRDEWGEFNDLCAWSPTSGQIASWLGVACIIGQESLSSQRGKDEKLWLHPSPLDWLQHGRTGVVVIDYEAARTVLADVGPIAVKSADHKAKLARQWRSPRVVVHEGYGIAEATVEAAA